MVHYDKSTIYKLCCKDPKISDIYVGSTTNFTRRKGMHKSACNNENGKCYNLKVYQTIREYGGWNNWDMVEVERYSASDKKDLHARERCWLEKLGATLNTRLVIPEVAKNKEYYAQYRSNNKEKILKHKAKYNTKNKELIAEKLAKNYQENKGEILEKRKEKVQCECGSEIRKADLAQHRKTKKHQKWLEQNTE